MQFRGSVFSESSKFTQHTTKLKNHTYSFGREKEGEREREGESERERSGGTNKEMQRSG